MHTENIKSQKLHVAQKQRCVLPPLTALYQLLGVHTVIYSHVQNVILAAAFATSCISDQPSEHGHPPQSRTGSRIEYHSGFTRQLKKIRILMTVGS
jgi:hypothetical protein